MGGRPQVAYWAVRAEEETLAAPLLRRRDHTAVRQAEQHGRHSRVQAGGVTHAAPRKYHDEIISLAFIHTKYGEPIAIMVFRRAILKVLCLTHPFRRRCS